MICFDFGKFQVAFLLASLATCDAAVIEVTAGGEVHEPTYQFSDSYGQHLANLTASSTTVTASGDLRTGNGTRVDDLATRLAAAESMIASLQNTVSQLQANLSSYATTASLSSYTTTANLASYTRVSDFFGRTSAGYCSGTQGALMGHYSNHAYWYECAKECMKAIPVCYGVHMASGSNAPCYAITSVTTSAGGSNTWRCWWAGL